MERCASAARARAGFTEAAHDSPVTNPFSHRTVVCRLRESRARASCRCTSLAPGVLVRVQSEQRCGTARPSGILPFHACMLNSESEISDSEIICIDMPGYPRGKHYFQ
eukprot:COSAG02_NODE_5174_length_4571_cov_182.081395_2_plen_108_part_00